MCKIEMDWFWANDEGRHAFPPEYSWTSVFYSGSSSLGKTPLEARGNFCLDKLPKDNPKSKVKKFIAVSSISDSHCPVLLSCLPATLGIWDAAQQHIQPQCLQPLLGSCLESNVIFLLFKTNWQFKGLFENRNSVRWGLYVSTWAFFKIVVGQHVSFIMIYFLFC